MREFHDLILSDWDVNLLDIIYAHESDPTDVFATIERIHSGRETALKPSRALAALTCPPISVPCQT